MRSKSYCIKGTPMSWQRAGRNGSRYYDAQAKSKLSFGLFLAQQHDCEPLFDSGIHLNIVFYMPIPRTVKDRTDSDYHIKAPDLDNLEKFCMDAMKGIVITDDRIICSKTSQKLYGKVPRTLIIITEVD